VPIRPFVLRLRREDGFMMMELLMAITIMAIALTALVAVFSSGITSMGGSSQRTTATLLADAQMETYRTMVYRDIGVDLDEATVGALDSTYTSDSACANPATGDTCAANGVQNTETEPTGTPTTHVACSTLDTWYPTTWPCVPSRPVSSTSTPASPDGRLYRVDTYAFLAPAITTGSAQRSEYKEVTVVVRDGRRLGTVLARESSDFVCVAAVNPNEPDDC
jgi:type II secretory pathway pseudopilin PulG